MLVLSNKNVSTKWLQKIKYSERIWIIYIIYYLSRLSLNIRSNYTMQRMTAFFDTIKPKLSGFARNTISGISLIYSKICWNSDLFRRFVFRAKNICNKEHRYKMIGKGDVKDRQREVQRQARGSKWRQGDIKRLGRDVNTKARGRKKTGKLSKNT